MVVYFKEAEMCAVLSLITVPALEQVSRDGCSVTQCRSVGGWRQHPSEQLHGQGQVGLKVRAQL